MNKLLLTVILLAGTAVLAQEMDRVPKQYSLEAGYRYVLKSDFDNQAPQGFTMLFDYAWQLSGFHKKKASYISVPIGYTMMTALDDTHNSVRVISYGWTVRHELARDKKIIPWLGYALLLNQYKESGVDGKVFGHQTRFSFGGNLNTSSRIIPFLKVEYSMTSYPFMGVAKAKNYDFFEVKAGVRF